MASWFGACCLRHGSARSGRARWFDAGARFITRVRAVRINDAGQELKSVRARRLDPKGYHEGTALTVKVTFDAAGMDWLCGCATIRGAAGVAR